MNKIDWDGLIDISKEDTKSSCKGVIFKAKLNTYYSKGKYVYQESMQILKRKSCPGCVECGWIHEELSETIDEYNLIEDFEDGALYTLHITDVTKDLKTGVCDDYNLVFRKYET